MRAIDFGPLCLIVLAVAYAPADAKLNVIHNFKVCTSTHTHFVHLLWLLFTLIKARHSRSIELASAQKLITDPRLSKDIIPLSYILDLRPDFEASSFTGKVKINLTWTAEAKAIELHAHYDLQIDETNVKVRLLNKDDPCVI